MEQKKNEQKTARILYITIIMVLLVMAIAVGLVTAAGRRNRPAESSASGTSFPATSDTLPDKDHTSPSVTTKAPEVTTAKTDKPMTIPSVTAQKEPITTTKQVAEVEAPVPTRPALIMPTIGDVAKTFSIDALVWSNTMEDYRTHNGIDICASVGEGVMAAADGIVTEVYAHPMMGHTVVIAHDGEAETVYQNLAEDIPVSVGDIVKTGTVIGAIGESAIIEIAEEPHLHFELLVGGKQENPLDYIAAATMTVVYEDN